MHAAKKINHILCTVSAQSNMSNNFKFVFIYPFNILYVLQNLGSFRSNLFSTLLLSHFIFIPISNLYHSISKPPDILYTHSYFNKQARSLYSHSFYKIQDNIQPVEIEPIMNCQMDLEQGWMTLVGPKTSCSVIHPHTSCLYEIFTKCKQVVGASSKLYALLYIAMLVVQFRKIHSQRKVKKTLLSWSKDYLWSLAFMCWTVGGMKSALCLLNNMGSPLDGTKYCQNRAYNSIVVIVGITINFLLIEIAGVRSLNVHNRTGMQISLHIYKKKTTLQTEQLKITMFYIAVWIACLFLLRGSRMYQEQKLLEQPLGGTLIFSLFLHFYYMTLFIEINYQQVLNFYYISQANFQFIEKFSLSIVYYQYKSNQYNTNAIKKIMQTIKHPTHSLDHNIRHLSTIIYNQYQLPLICDFLSYPLQLDDTHILLPDPSSKISHDSNTNDHASFYIIVKVYDISTAIQQSSIQKLIGLSDRVLCVELDPDLQSKIQKMFLAVMPELYVRYQQGRSISRPQLCFVNEGYRKMFSREAEGIYYFRTLKQLTSTHSQSAGKYDLSQYLSKRLAPSSTIRIENEDKSAEQVVGISIGQFISMYNNTNLSQRQVAQIRYSMLSYKQSMNLIKNKQRAQKYVLVEGINDVNKGVLKDVAKADFSKKDMANFQWKYTCLRNFCDLLYEKSVNNDLVRKYKQCNLFELPQQAIILQIRQFHRKWICNTLHSLRRSFSSIVNRRDTKTIQQFRQQCSKTQQILSNCLFHCNTNTINFNLLQQMQKQIQQFINAHELIIKDEYLSSFKYAVYMLKYKWKNQPRIYYKGTFFMLLCVLAWIGGSLLWGGLIAVGGVILLAINI